MIRAFQKVDIERVMQIWLESNIEAHSFIAKEYWVSNYSMVQEQILQAEIYVYETDNEIQGFVGIVDDYIAGIFVTNEYRSRGIGRQLLDYVKTVHNSLSLNVYQKNNRAVDFYLQEGFTIRSKDMDDDTGEMDYSMSWCKLSS